MCSGRSEAHTAALSAAWWAQGGVSRGGHRGPGRWGDRLSSGGQQGNAKTNSERCCWGQRQVGCSLPLAHRHSQGGCREISGSLSGGEKPGHAWGPGAQFSTPRSWPVVTPFLSCSSPRAASLTPGPGAAGPGHRRERREKTSGNTDEEPQRCSALLSRMRPELDGRLRGAAPRPRRGAPDPRSRPRDPRRLERPPVRPPGVTKRVRRLTLVRRAPLGLMLLVLLAHGDGAEGSSESCRTVAADPRPWFSARLAAELAGSRRKRAPRPEVTRPPAPALPGQGAGRCARQVRSAGAAEG